jgi:hypothetical protein
MCISIRAVAFLYLEQAGVGVRDNSLRLRALSPLHTLQGRRIQYKSIVEVTLSHVLAVFKMLFDR